MSCPRILSCLTATAAVFALLTVCLIPTAAADSPGTNFPFPQPLQHPADLLELPQVGDDIDAYLKYPVPRPPGEIKELAVTEDEVCALTHGGLLYCWEFGVDDELLLFTGMLAAITAGTHHFCGLDSASRAVCWDDRAASEGAPNPPLSDIAAGDAHSCAVDTTGEVTCWGRQLDADHRNPPDGPFQHIEAGGPNTCATAAWDYAKCWGPNLPDAPFDHPVHKLSVSSNVVCAIDGANRPHCQFADDVRQFDPPAPIAIDVAAGADFACTLDTTSSIACDGTAAPDLPETPPLSTIIDASDTTLCAVTATGGVRCWDQTGEILGY